LFINAAFVLLDEKSIGGLAQRLKPLAAIVRLAGRRMAGLLPA